MSTENETQAEQEQIESILLDVVKAQGSVSSKNLAQHLQEVTYPLLARLATFTKGTRDDFDAAVAAFSNAEEAISAANAEFFSGYIDAVFAFVQKYLPAAQQSAATGDAELFAELRGLYEGGKAVKQVLEEIPVQDDEPDEPEE